MLTFYESRPFHIPSSSQPFSHFKTIDREGNARERKFNKEPERAERRPIEPRDQQKEANRHLAKCMFERNALRGALGALR